MAKTRHGMCKVPGYNVYNDMMARCYNKNNRAYKNYGGRGIVVCAEWKGNPRQFFDDMGSPPKGMSIDRIKNDKGYDKGNCRWVDSTTQNRNKRNIRKHKGKSIPAWEDELGLNRRVLSRLLYRGLSFDEALKHLSL